MKELNSLNNEDLSYLKVRWTGDIEDLRTQVAKDMKRLDRRIASTESDAGELTELEQELQEAQADLNEMIEGGLSPGAIERKQVEVNELSQELEEERLAPSGITPREAQQQVRNISVMEMEITFLEGKIAEIDTLMNDAA